MTSDLHAYATTVSRFKKQRFLLELSEDDFRDRVVRPLLLRQGLRDGRDTCGPTEQGKDAVFLADNALGLQEVYVVQTKKGALTLARKATTNIVEATTQLRTALATRVVFVATKEKKYPDKAILCASGKINDAARAHIVDEVKDPRVMFLDPDELIPLIDRHFPELWFDIDASVRPYLRALKRVVEGVDEDVLAELGSRAVAGAATDRMFVTLFLHRTEIRVRRRRGKIEREPEIVELPIQAITSRREKLVLITGAAGSGKSTALRRIAYLLVGKSLGSSGAESAKTHVPVLLKAATVAASAESLLQDANEETKRLAESSKPAFTTEDLKQGRVVVLVDSLDELPTNEARTTVLTKILEFHRVYPQCQVIVTSRDYSFVTMLESLAPFARFRLTPISLNQAQQLLEKIQRSRQLPTHASREIMRRLQQVHGVDLNPMLVTVFAATSDYSRKDVPANITELFKKYTEMMLGRWSATKGLGQQFHFPLKDFLLKQVAFEMHRRQATSISLVEFTKIVTDALTARGLTAQVDLLLNEMLHQSGLFRILDDDSIEFRHLLLQEFFAGRGLPSSELLESLVADDWWQRAIVFFFGEHPDDIKGLESIKGAVQPRTDPERFRAAITLGLALQACYLVEVREKGEVLKWVLQVLARTKAQFVEEATSTGVPAIMAFTYYYVFGREGVACSVPDEIRELVRANMKAEATTEDERETAEFWQLVSRIEEGLSESTQKLVRKYDPEDSRLLFGVFLSLRMIEHLRFASKSERAIAQRLADAIHPRVSAVGEAFSKEFKGILLEARKGEVSLIDAMLPPAPEPDEPSE